MKGLLLFFGKLKDRDKAELERYGAEEILAIHIDEEMEKNHELLAELARMAVEEERPQIILAGATINGRTLMPLIAVQLKTGLTADCTELSIDKDRKFFCRHVLRSAGISWQQLNARIQNRKWPR